jgi:hypothetical protein
MDNDYAVVEPSTGRVYGVIERVSYEEEFADEMHACRSDEQRTIDTLVERGVAALWHLSAREATEVRNYLGADRSVRLEPRVAYRTVVRVPYGDTILTAQFPEHDGYVVHVEAQPLKRAS